MRWSIVAWSVLLSACSQDGIRIKGFLEDSGLPSLGTASDTGTASLARTCDRISVDGTCTEFTGAGWTANDIVAECNASVVSASCPSNDTLGRCTLAVGGALGFDRYFYLGAYYGASDVTLLQNSCNGEGGTWVDL